MTEEERGLPKLAQAVRDLFAKPSTEDAAARWRRTSSALAAILDSPAGERSARLSELTAHDAALRRELESLLDAHDETGLVDAPVLDAAPLVLSEEESARALPWRSGAVTDRYRIIEKIGSGGMGTVVKAWDSRLEREVALKFLSSHLLDEAKASDRFRLEARAIASLDHPNVCAIHDVGEAKDEQFFISMPFYEGETLAAIIARGALLLPLAIDIALQTARGLAAAHAQALTHRDIKPANLIVTTDGVVKILDFGVAKLTGMEMTAPGSKPGTASYMSPEQSRGDPVDSRADLWALGVVMYEMLTGVRPFLGNARTVAMAICTEEPRSIVELRADISPELAVLVASALAKRPSDRPASAAIFADRLAAFAADYGGSLNRSGDIVG